MSKDGYIKGFCKAASDRGVDPVELARYVLAKKAEGDGVGLMDKMKGGIRDAVASTAEWYKKRNEAEKALIGAGLGSAAGVGLGSAIYGKKGIRPGAVLGAAVGGAGAVDWKAVGDKIDKIREDREKSKKDSKGK